MRQAIERALAPRFARLSEEIAIELLEDSLITREGDQIQFSHFSFQEFLTASDIRGDLHGVVRIREVLKAYLDGDDWWKEVVSFYVGLSSNPKETAELVVNLPGRFDPARFEGLIWEIHNQFPDCGIDELYPQFLRQHLEEASR